MLNVNEMDYDQWNEWDGNEWQNEWDGLWYMKWMRSKWLDKYVTSLSLSIWKMVNIFFWVLQLS